MIPPSISGSLPAAILLSLAGCASVAAPHTEPALRRNAGMILAEDPQLDQALERAVGEFLQQAATGNFSDDIVDPADIERHGVFFRRVSGYGAVPGIGTPTVLKAYTLDGTNYFVTLAFTGERDGAPFVDMMVEIVATPQGNGYRFHCPFEERTQAFHERTIDDVCFRFSGAFDEARAREFLATRAHLARLSGVEPAPLEYFAFQSLDELLKSYGLVFDASRCNFLGHDLGIFDDGRRRYLTGMGDECYLWGYVSEFLQPPGVDRTRRYGVMAAGFKTLYSGYWLERTPMEPLVDELRDLVQQQPGLDLLDLFRKGRNGQTQGHAPSWVMAAILCEQALEEGDYDGLMRLVYSGENGERFFDELEAILGIGEANFGTAITERIRLRQALRNGPLPGTEPS